MIAVLYVLFAAAGPWMSRQFALSRCLPEEMKIADIAHAKGGKCLVSWSRLDQSGTRSLYRARYEMSVDAKDSAAPKVVSEVLYESRSGRGLLRPLWLTQQLTDEFEIEHVTLHRVGKWRLVEVFGCLKGTDGCGQDIVLWTSGEPAKPVENFRSAFNALLPKGYTTLKAPIVRLEKMRIEGDGWTERDPNGGPSLSMACRLHFDGARFTLSNCLRSHRPR